ncbi:potassium transporter TrkG [Herbiconiux sp.]|uniref:TrkH family potassium uptake protein n=1 Tax=Herbiconiux sp. TaxID=1871186 RepID=UPI0025C73E41|nr:potassium transporter TrkG [Herbiconiux sp.]
MTFARTARTRRARDPFRLAIATSRVAKISPALLALAIFLLVALLFTGLLTLPIAAADGRATVLHDAMFTAFSAVTVTGLVSVDTAEHWSFFGELVILLGIQIGGLGIITIALLLSRAVTRSFGVQVRIFAQQGIGASKLGEVQSLLRIVILTTLVLEGVLALVLIPRFIIVEGSFLRGTWDGIFYAVSAFNNAGFAPNPGGIMAYDGDLWITIPVMVGVFVGSLGFPVFLVLMMSRHHWRTWSLHAKLTLTTTTVFLVLGALTWMVLEWSNTDTIGGMTVGEKIYHALFASTMMRSGGFSLTDYGESSPVTLLVTDALMFVGGGSASTAGGIKVTTIAILFLAIVAEAKGDKNVMIFGRTIPQGALRVAISVTFLGATLVLVATGLIMLVSDAPLDRILFEVISAFATCGLSVGLTEELHPAGLYVLTALMFAGRIGPIGLASALAVRRRNLLFRYPDERPVIG